MRWLFADFLDDPGEYRDAQAHWNKLFVRSLPRRFGSEELKKQYITSSDNDGNPIFSAICLPLQLAVRVIQQPVGDADDLDLDWWIDSVDLRPGVVIEELVISCCPSEENQPRVKGILRDWFTEGNVVARESPDEPLLWWEDHSVSYMPELCLQ